jgi:hypothetical protein
MNTDPITENRMRGKLLGWWGKMNFLNSDDSFQETSRTFMCVDNLILIIE